MIQKTPKYKCIICYVHGVLCIVLEGFIYVLCAISQLPAHWHNAVQGNPASLHLHFLEQRGSALQPHLRSSLQTLAASGKRVHKGVHESATLVHPYVSGDGRDWIAFRLLDQIPHWYTA